MEYNKVKNDLHNSNNYTPFTDIQPLKYYNIIGVLIDYCSSFQPCQKFTFTLTDSKVKVEINYFISNKGSLCPLFCQNYQLIIIHNVQFEARDNGHFIGILNENVQYKILTNSELTKYPRYMMMISRAKEAHKSNLNLPFISFKPQQQDIKANYNEHVEPIQNIIRDSDQNQITLSNGSIKLTENGLNEMPQGIGYSNIYEGSNQLLSENHKRDSNLSLTSYKPQQEIKKAKHIDNAVDVLNTAASSSCNQIKLNNNLAKASKNAFNTIPKSVKSNTMAKSYNTLLSDIKPGKSVKIIAQILRLESSYYNRDEYIITDYTSGNSLSSYNIELSNTINLYGNYFLKLTVWDDQRENLQVSKYYYFSLVKSKLDKRGKLELNINGTKPNSRANITVQISANQAEYKEIRERMRNVISGVTIRPASSMEVIRDSRFSLVKNIRPNEFYDMILLILKKFKYSTYGRYTLLCTDLTSNSMLKNNPSYQNTGITIDPKMCINLICWDDAATLIEQIVDANPNNSNILQFRGLKSELDNVHGIELHLRSNATIMSESGLKMLEFDPIPNCESIYYKELEKRCLEYSNQINLNV